MSERALTCHEVIDLLSNYIEGALSPDERRRVDEHLALCDGCETYLGQIRETIRLSGVVVGGWLVVVGGGWWWLVVVVVVGGVFSKPLLPRETRPS